MSNVVITGANRGIGLALVKAYADAGDRVYALCRSPEKAEELSQLASASNGKVSLHQVDVGNAQSTKEAVKAIGDVPVDVLLNVAGILGGDPGSILDVDFTEEKFDDWRDAFEVMTIGPFRLAQGLLPNLLKAKGKVMTVSSQLAASTWPYGGYYAYGATKAGVGRVMRSMAIDLKDKGVYVASIHPGYVQTDMGGPDAEITPAESAAGIKKVVEALNENNTGDFFKWNGEHHAW